MSGNFEDIMKCLNRKNKTRIGTGTDNIKSR
jgi:hypothetical protein